MSPRRTRTLLARSLLAAAAFCASSASHAVIFTGHWDPYYGSPFPDLGWSVQAVFNVPAACLAQADGTYSAGPCGSFSFLSVDVSFYNELDLTQTPLETFALNGVGAVPGIVSIARNQVVGIAGSSFFDSFVPGRSGAAASIDGAGLYSFNLILQSGREAQLYYGPPTGFSPDCVKGYGGLACGKSLEAAIGVFTPVPEPATGAMMLAGLGAAAIFARQRRKAVTASPLL